MPEPNSGWRLTISSKIAIERRPGAAFSIGTISASKTSANGSGRRRPRTPFFIDGKRGSRARRCPVAGLNDALAAETVSVSE